MQPMLNDLYQHLDPVAISLGPLQVRWYGLAYILGFIVAGLLAYRVAKRWKLNFDAYEVMTFICYCAFGIIICARLGYCLFYGDGYYLAHPLDILALSKGGMSFHGGLVGAILGGAVYAAMQKMPFLTLADLLACCAPVGLFFGRCANFINGELYGAPTDWPVGVDFTGNGVMYQPSQLYEALLEGLVILLVLQVLARKVPPRPQGFFLGAFLSMYAVFRMLIEFVRLPDEQIGYFFGSWGTMGQLLSLPMLLAGIVLIAVSLKLKRPQRGLPAVGEDMPEDTPASIVEEEPAAGAGASVEADELDEKAPQD